MVVSPGEQSGKAKRDERDSTYATAVTRRARRVEIERFVNAEPSAEDRAAGEDMETRSDERLKEIERSLERYVYRYTLIYSSNYMLLYMYIHV